MKIQIKRIVFTKPNTAEFLYSKEIDTDEIGENQVVVKSFYTTVSSGTEKANITGPVNVGPNEKTVSFPRVLNSVISRLSNPVLFSVTAVFSVT